MKHKNAAQRAALKYAFQQMQPQIVKMLQNGFSIDKIKQQVKQTTGAYGTGARGKQ